MPEDKTSLPEQAKIDRALVLNFLSAQFSSSEIEGLSLEYTSRDALHTLQDAHKGQWLLRRVGKIIQAVALNAAAPPLTGKAVTFSLQADPQLFEKLLDEAVRRKLRTTYSETPVPEYGLITLVFAQPSGDIVREALNRKLNLQKRLGFLHAYRTYTFESAHLQLTSTEQPQVGLRIKLSTRWAITQSVAQLVESNFLVAGRYVVPLDNLAAGFGHKITGIAREIRDGWLHLDEAQGDEQVKADSYTIEASLENVAALVKHLAGEAEGTSTLRLIRNGVASFLGAEPQQARLTKIVESLAKEPLTCAHKLLASLQSSLHTAGPGSPASTIALKAPGYVLTLGSAPITNSIATALDAKGPFDRDSFTQPNPNILVIVPKPYRGQADQFLGRWRDGNLPPVYMKGFIKKYRLRGCNIHVVDFTEASTNPADNYQAACLQAVQESRELIRPYHLAFVVVSERHRALGFQDPYLIAKSILMGAGIPVQMLEIETVQADERQWPFILNNLALASYAKLGGTPWTLSSSKGEGITHEVIVGIGSAAVRETRLSKAERYVGIATLFNYDGVYLLSKTSTEATFDNYAKALEDTLVASLTRVSERKGWRPGEHVRLIFHAFKPLKNKDIIAVKELVNRRLSQFKVDFAFLTINHDHAWMLYDPTSPGHTAKSGSVRGKQVPFRGNAAVLNPREALLCVTGPAEMKITDQGAPAPLHLVLHSASSFVDLRYLTEQLFNFTYMSWKTFNLPPFPVTIGYSDMIARLLGRLRHVRNWNANVLETTNLCDSLWFL